MPCHRTTLQAINHFAVFIRYTVYVSYWHVVLCSAKKPNLIALNKKSSELMPCLGEINLIVVSLFFPAVINKYACLSFSQR